MKNKIFNYLFLVVLSGIIITCDQFSKAWVRTNIALGEMWSPWEWLTPYARFVHWYNTGAAFGMFQGMSEIFTILAIIVIVVILYYYPRIPSSDWFLRLALGFQLGGATGNLIDRIFYGHVIDFISIGNFAVFNVADASISTGVGILLLGVWIQERNNKKITTNPEAFISDINDIHPEKR